jgi:hypothetical protein
MNHPDEVVPDPETAEKEGVMGIVEEIFKTFL